MAYTYNATLLLGPSQTGLASTLRAALRDTAGTIHATLRDISAGFVGGEGGVYGWVSASIPDGYRGSVWFYVGTLGAAADFSGVAVKAAANVSPQEAENNVAASAAADALLARSIAGGADGGRTVRQALQALRNRVARPAGSGTGTVYAEDDATPAWTFTVTASPGASPVVEIDPS